MGQMGNYPVLWIAVSLARTDVLRMVLNPECTQVTSSPQHPSFVTHCSVQDQLSPVTAKVPGCDSVLLETLLNYGMVFHIHCLLFPLAILVCTCVACRAGRLF